MEGEAVDSVFGINLRTLLTSMAAVALTPGFAPIAKAETKVTWPRNKDDAEQLRTIMGAPALGCGIESPSCSGILAVGHRMKSEPAPVTMQDRWHWGSITKAMTATLMALAVEQGLLHWDDRASAILGLANEEVHEGMRDVTLLHLLSHRAGIPTYNIDWYMLTLPREEVDARASRFDVARKTLMQAPEAPVGSQFIYANRGYIVAAAMLEAKTGKPWETLMQSQIFAPLGMAGAGFGAPGTQGQLDEPVGHASWLMASVTPHPPGSMITDNPAVMGPAGRVHARLSDMLSFLRAHRDRAPLLSRASWDRLHTPPFGGDYALGWFVRPEGLWHQGSNTLWNAEVLVQRDRSVVATICCNDGDYNKVTPALHQALTKGIEALSRRQGLMSCSS